MRRTAYVLVAVATGLIGRATHASQQAPVFRSRAEYVVVDAVATDRKDAPVRDLTRDEFQISERGLQQSIVEFEHVNIPSVLRADTAAREWAVSADVATNIPAAAQGRLFVVVIDDLHTLEYEIASVKKIVTTFLRSLSSSDEVAVVFAGRSDLSLNFTSDLGRQIEAVNNVRAAFGFGVDVLGRSANGAASGNLVANGRALAFTLTNVARSLAASPHARRAIVLVSAGSPVEQRPGRSTAEGQIIFGEMNRAFEAARLSNAPIYTIDPRGLVQPGDAVRGGIGTAQVQVSSIVEKIRIQKDNMTTPAVNTGGRAFVDQSSLDSAVQAIVAENSDYYVLGYRPTPMPPVDLFQPIDISVKRPGVRVRARAGYMPKGPPDSNSSEVEKVELALKSGIDVKALGLRAHVAPILAIGRSTRTLMTLDVAYPPEEELGPPEADLLTVLAVAADSEGRIVATSGRQFSMGSMARRGRTGSVVITDFIDLPPQNLTLRIGVTSKRLAKTGSVQVPVDVSNPADKKLQMSGLLLGRSSSAMETMLGADRAQTVLPFQPTTVRTFDGGEALRVFARLTWGAEYDGIQVTVGLREIPGSAQQLKLESTTETPPAKGQRFATLDALVPVGTAAGQFTLEVVAKLPNGQSARRELPLRVK